MVQYPQYPQCTQCTWCRTHSVHSVHGAVPTSHSTHSVHSAATKASDFLRRCTWQQGPKGRPLQTPNDVPWVMAISPIPGKFCSTLAGIRSMPPLRLVHATPPKQTLATQPELSAGFLQAASSADSKNIWLHDNRSTTPEKGANLGLHCCLQPFPKFSWWWRERLMQASG